MLFVLFWYKGHLNPTIEPESYISLFCTLFFVVIVIVTQTFRSIGNSTNSFVMRHSANRLLANRGGGDQTIDPKSYTSCYNSVEI